MNKQVKNLPPCIYVLAGPNGGGKSSIVGAEMLADADYFNPDVESKTIRARDPGISEYDANSIAWKLGKSFLERAISEGKNFAIETTLGGNTITELLEQAADSGLEVRVWFICLASAEQHIKRVQARVAKGGHNIPEEKIRERFDRGRANLIRLLPRMTEVRLFDNSIEADPADGREPKPRLILHFHTGSIVSVCPAAETPIWAKPLVEAATKLAAKKTR